MSGDKFAVDIDTLDVPLPRMEHCFTFIGKGELALGTLEGGLAG